MTGHVGEDISRALEHVLIPRQNMEDERALNSGDWDELQKPGRATQM